LWLVKTKSPVNFQWVNFVEGLHRHAATILALLCTKFDYENKIQPGSLSIQDFKAAKIPHFVDPKISPEEQIKLIMNGQESSKILKNNFIVEVYIPKMIHGNILELMESMCKQSEWISESKMRAANKTISTLLSIWLEETLVHSRSKKRNNCHSRPKLTSMFTYQNPVTAETYAATVQNNDGNIYGYCPLLNCNEWTRFIKDPFNKFVRDNFVGFISPDESTKGPEKN
jgi:hypothetical protein